MDLVTKLRALVQPTGVTSIADADLFENAADEIERLRSAIYWALGENGEFQPRPEGKGPYWWRTELRSRSGLLMRQVSATPPQS